MKNVKKQIKINVVDNNDNDNINNNDNDSIDNQNIIESNLNNKWPKSVICMLKRLRIDLNINIEEMKMINFFNCIHAAVISMEILRSTEKDRGRRFSASPLFLKIK